MSFVLDASFAAAWLLPEEHSAAAKAAIDHTAERLTVPSIFWDEASNIVLIAERRSRIGAGEAVFAMARLRCRRSTQQATEIYLRSHRRTD